MSVEQYKEIVRRVLEEGFNEGHPEAWDDLLHPDYVNHSMPAPTTGAEGFREVTAMFKFAFPDMRVEVLDVIAEGEQVASRGYFTGTHQGEFMRIPATGRAIRVEYIDIWKVVDGKLKENWVQMDMLGLMQQLGALPAPQPS